MVNASLVMSKSLLVQIFSFSHVGLVTVIYIKMSVWPREICYRNWNFFVSAKCHALDYLYLMNAQHLASKTCYGDLNWEEETEQFFPKWYSISPGLNLSWHYTPPHKSNRYVAMAWLYNFMETLFIDKEYVLHVVFHFQKLVYCIQVVLYVYHS